MLYTWNLYDVIYQFYLNKKNKWIYLYQIHKEITHKKEFEYMLSIIPWLHNFSDIQSKDKLQKISRIYFIYLLLVVVLVL